MDNWIFEITDYTSGAGVTTTIETPQGWQDIVFKMERSKEFHGVFFDYTFDSVEFVGGSADILEAAYIENGIESLCELTITWDCDVQQVLYTGKFNFHKYSKTCSYERGCWISIPVESTGALMKMKNRIAQDVNLDCTEDFAGNAVVPYSALGGQITLQAKGIYLEDSIVGDAMVTTGDIGTDYWGAGTPTLDVFVNIWFSDNSIEVNEFEDLIPMFIKSVIRQGGGYPSVTEEEVWKTQQLYQHGNPYIAYVDMSGRLKGRAIFTPVVGNAITLVSYSFRLYYLSVGDPSTDFPTLITSYLIPIVGVVSGTYEFDFTLGSVFANIPVGAKIWFTLSLQLNTPGAAPYVEIQYDPETNIVFTGTQYAPATPCKSYLLNESIARVIEAITDSEMTAISDYFGRTDAEPYVSTADGCGSLECITNGTLIRQSDIGGAGDALMTISLQKLFNGLKAIHCVGMGMEEDTDRPYFYGVPYNRMRVEPVEYFYQDDIVLLFPSVNTLEVSSDIDGYYSSFKFGYDMYGGSEFKHGDDFFSKREYRSSLSSVKNELNGICDFVASGYAIETTRGQFNEIDSRYDNEVFIICLTRDVGFVVEQGNIDLPSNIIDTPTLYNYRISPWRNALRWYKILFANYNANSTDANYKFVSGEGNYNAQGVVSGGCVVERDYAANSELGDLNVYSFQSYTDAVPLWTNEIVKFSYPLTVYEYNLIKATPYGKIGFSFANANMQFGWVISIDYMADKGVADFVLKMSR